jgi:dTDP-6-deoxy-L-talose 4-dehydrogenase (NAD+)
MPKVAVTGASGFLGRHVLAALARTDAGIVALSRTPRSRALVSPRWTSFDLAAPPPDAFENLGRPDVLIHLAWDGLPNYRAARHVEAELPAQSRFLRGLIAAGLKTLVVSGTCFEYGMQSGCLSESMATMPSNPYGIAKDALRSDLEDLARSKPFDLRWLRLFYLYGEGQAPTALYPQLRAAIARGDRKFDMSAGEQERDFMKVEDAAAAIVAAALAPQAPHILNICSGAPVPVRRLVERWKAELSSGIELNLGAYPYPDYEPMSFWGDDTRLRALLGATRA